MTDHLPILLLLFPLFGSLICVLLGKNNAAHSWVVAMISLGGSALLSLLMLIKVLGLKLGDFRYRMGGWPESSSYEVGIELRVDVLACLIVLAVMIVGFLNTIYSKTRVSAEVGEKGSFFYALIQLLIVGLCGIIMTNDAFNLYVLIEITSLTS